MPCRKEECLTLRSKAEENEKELTALRAIVENPDGEIRMLKAENQRLKDQKKAKEDELYQERVKFLDMHGNLKRTEMAVFYLKLELKNQREHFAEIANSKGVTLEELEERHRSRMARWGLEATNYSEAEDEYPPIRSFHIPTIKQEPVSPGKAEYEDITEGKVEEQNETPEGVPFRMSHIKQEQVTVAEQYHEAVGGVGLQNPNVTSFQMPKVKKEDETNLHDKHISVVQELSIPNVTVDDLKMGDVGSVTYLVNGLEVEGRLKKRLQEFMKPDPVKALRDRGAFMKTPQAMEKARESQKETLGKLPTPEWIQQYTRATAIQLAHNFVMNDPDLPMGQVEATKFASNYLCQTVRNLPAFEYLLSEKFSDYAAFKEGNSIYWNLMCQSEELEDKQFVETSLKIWGIKGVKNAANYIPDNLYACCLPKCRRLPKALRTFTLHRATHCVQAVKNQTRERNLDTKI